MSDSNKKMRYQIVLEYNGLSDYDKNVVGYALKASSPTDAIRRSDSVLKSAKLSYYAKQFLYALATSAEADLAGI